MINNWEDIVHDQLTTLAKCGLAHYAHHMTISYTNGPLDRLQQVVNQHFSIFPPIPSPSIMDSESPIMTIEFLPGPEKIPWESSIMNAIVDTCHDYHHHERTSPTEDDLMVFYFHNKGASKYKYWKQLLFQNPPSSPPPKKDPYSHSLYWRKYLEYFTLERPTLCLTALSHGAYTCGIEFQTTPSPHYSGNFWSAACHYIVQSQDVMTKFHPSETYSYTSAELWIGRGSTIVPPSQNYKFVGLVDDERNLYDHLIYPSEYEYEKGKEEEVLQIITDSLRSRSSGIGKNDEEEDVNSKQILESFLFQQHSAKT